MSKLDAPSFRLDPGVYRGPLELTIDSNEPGASIIYTTDDSDPSSVSGVVYRGPIVLTRPATIKARVRRDRWISSNIIEGRFFVYPKQVVNSEPIVLKADEVMEIEDTYYVHSNNIVLRDNARLIIRNSFIEHRKDYAFQYSLEAYGNSKVIVEDTIISNQCTGSLNWNFLDESSFTATNVAHKVGCNTWNYFTNKATASIANWPYFGATTCDGASLDVKDSAEMEIELCFPQNATVDTALPSKITEFSMSQKNDPKIEFNVHIANSSVESWGINIAPGLDLTVRDAHAVSVSVVVGYPWQNKTVVLEGLGSKLYQDQTWEIADARLRLVNTRTDGWEPNAFGNNTLIIRNSDYTASANNSSDATYIIENSTVRLLMASERVRMTVKDSVVKGDVIAREASHITLINTVVQAETDDRGNKINGKVIAKDKSKVTLVNSKVQGQMSTGGNGTIEVVPEAKVFPEVWSMNGYDGQSYEFKTNCFGDYPKLEDCFLFYVTRVVVIAPDGQQFDLKKDFNVNAYSGEVTRRWVLYGPTGGGLPGPGKYRFLYYVGSLVALEQEIDYKPEVVDFPKNVKWARQGNDLVVTWTPPKEARSGMWYKVLVFPENGSLISQVFDWNVSSARLPNVPLANRQKANLNVAIYFSGGYAYSEYLPMEW